MPSEIGSRAWNHYDVADLRPNFLIASGAAVDLGRSRWGDGAHIIFIVTLERDRWERNRVQCFLQLFFSSVTGRQRVLSSAGMELLKPAIEGVPG
jgi:hypothetical protein